MSTIEVRLAGGGDCDIAHRESGARLRTSLAPEYGGKGNGFSSTDLLAAALGSCIASNLEPVALRHGVPIDALRVTVDKRLGSAPKRIESLDAVIRVPHSTPAAIRVRLDRAAQQCVVHGSLSAGVKVSVTFLPD